MIWTSEDIAKATGGKAIGPSFTASSVVIDSRKLTKGALFVALKGERTDGHEHLKDAASKGAGGALVERMAADVGLPCIQVGDAPKALIDLAQASRARTKAEIIAVTGSVGKTGTKEAIRTALESAGKVFATQGNLNNHIGLPLSLANLAPDARFGVFELGMNHAGELAGLTRIARPHIAVITNVEAVHLEFFPDVEAIADAKAEIMEGVEAGGTVILNRDNAHFARLAAKARGAHLKIVTFGAGADADCRLLEYRLEDMGAHIEAVIHGIPIRYRLQATGRHWALTSLAALAAAVAAGADLANAAAQLAHFEEPEGRGRLHKVTLERGTLTVMDDCYNASPASTAAAIHKLAELKTALSPNGRAIAILGDMLELGSQAPALHKGLQEALDTNGIDRVHLAGPLMRNLYDALPEAMRGLHAPDAKTLAGQISADLRAGDIVLIKGSRGSRMDIVLNALMQSPSSFAKEPAHAV